MTLDARNPGDWGNTANTAVGGGLICQVTAGSTLTPTSSPATTVATFNLRILVGGNTATGTEVEFWPDLSPDPNSSRYAPTILNTYSNYVRVRSGQVDIAPFVGATTGALTFSSTGLFTGGSIQDADADAAAYGRALDLLDTINDSLLINVVGKSDTTTVNLALTKAQTRGTSFVIIDPNPASTTTVAISNAVASYSPKGWGAPYYGMLTMVDPSKSGIGAVRNTYPGGAVAGLYVRTEIERTVAKPPAGYNADIRNALGTVLNLTENDIGTLYNSGVNAFKAIPGAGVVVLGARTLETSKPDKYISIRRSLNYVKQRSIEVTRFAVFEPNDQRLWNAINVRLGSMLTDFWGAGGLKGRSPGEAFFVVCDETVNTPAVIDSGEVRVQVGVALQYPGEFVVITISQLAGGISE
jgi:phage tail sheath protein FI